MAKAGAAILRTFPSSVGVPESNRQALIALLNARLADSTDLRTQVKWAHWNVKGLHFIQSTNCSIPWPLTSKIRPTALPNALPFWAVSPMVPPGKSPRSQA